MSDIILYSTKCPKCIILEKKLKEKNISFTEINDIEIMLELNLLNAPNLKIDGVMMNFSDAIKWVNEQV